jgi:hypothetical protein
VLVLGVNSAKPLSLQLYSRKLADDRVWSRTLGAAFQLVPDGGSGHREAARTVEYAPSGRDNHAGPHAMQAVHG